MPVYCSNLFPGEKMLSYMNLHLEETDRAITAANRCPLPVMALDIDSGTKINTNIPDAVKPKDKSNLDKSFRDFIIDFQGLRKSGQMHKIRLSQYNYQLVASLGGHSPEVLMKNYDEALETEKRSLANRIESDFYTSPSTSNPSALKPAAATSASDNQDNKAQILAEQLAGDPELLQQAMQIILASTRHA